MYCSTEEYLIAAGNKTGIALKESVRDADYALEYGEYVNYVLTATMYTGMGNGLGVIAVTTHRLLCVTTLFHDMTLVSMPLAQGIRFGDASGFIIKRIPVSCGHVSIDITAKAAEISTLIAAVKGAECSLHLQEDIRFNEAFILHQNVVQAMQSRSIKKAHVGERRLSAEESGKYAPCPNCKSKVIVEKNGKILCAKCGYQF